jgi:hypothetical protein
MIGALKVIAQDVAVRGIVSNVSGETAAELIEYANDVPPGNFEVKVFGSGSGLHDVPHQKLIVVDGLLAFKGSANLTIPAWRKAADGLDIIEAVTDVEEVVQLHNRYFSPVWAQASGIGSQITMEEIPF